MTTESKIVFRPIEDIQADINEKLNLNIPDTTIMALYSNTGTEKNKGMFCIDVKGQKQKVGFVDNGMLYTFDGMGSASGAIPLKKYGS